MPRPCSLHRTDPHVEPRPDSCGTCALYVADPKVRAAMDRPGGVRAQVRAQVRGAPAPPAAPFPCRFRGGPTGDTVSCPTCRGRVELKVFACAVHGTCTPGKAAPGVACCRGCPDREPTG